jgi:hypothetical protein
LQRNYELRIDLEDFNGNKAYAKYSTFYVGGAATKYKLHVGGYVIVLKVFAFALKVNIYLQNMSINRRLGRFDQKMCIFVVFVCSSSQLHAQ